MPRKRSIPSYRLHKQSGQAVVTLSDPTGFRKDYLLGRYDSPESRTEYVRIITEWETNGRRLLAISETDKHDFSVNELILSYYQFASGYYVKNGQPTSEIERIKRSLRFVKELYGHTPARDFGPLALKSVREKMIEADYSRIHINHCIGCIKRCFKWGVENELIPPSVFHGLSAVSGLRKGRTEAKESKRVLPVSERVIKATLPYLLPPIKAMVQIQQLTGMRPGEVVIMRPCDIDRSGDVWFYTPSSHKTEHHEVERKIPLGQLSQQIISPLLCRDPQSYLFSPREAMFSRRESLRAKRKSPVQPSQVCRRKRKPKRQPSDHYLVTSYGQSIRKAIIRANKKNTCPSCKSKTPQEYCDSCKKNQIPHWHPHQLRHSYATEVRKKYGLEGAQVVLGHSSADVTQVYAERDLSLAERIAREIG